MKDDHLDALFPKKTAFLNADLIILSHRDLRDFAETLERNDLMTLHVQSREDGLWQATFELESESGDESFHKIMDGLLNCIEGLPINLR
ncbi:hypothetical protein [Chitinimonas sp. BJB300]|uniref:hypothetical protein n=1 Tax=Chitinimonas sp. BJB300 TaxID=1559339 RepID=UPI000C10C364|nr:hypothetical protein [Chitinimonas sp. BJB300]PHV12933.1 hypothetical protein CSQ89_03365 [Chitinimonas sp. BJB300]TSJ88502.1 hypothetical protein FG002_010030 [Chitinimonas sp. BJB300]